MVITHHGGQCIKVAYGDLTLVFDPISKKSTFTPARFGADIALVSRNHPDMNGVEEVSYGDKVPFAVTGPGEYERGGVTIQGYLTKSKYGLTKGEEEAINTVYAVSLEDMNLVHLGALVDKELPEDAREGIGDVDILFVPVGAGGVLTPSQAHDLATTLEPKLIIPIHWSGMGAAKSLEAFLKEGGGADETVEKLTVKKKDVLAKEGDIIVVKP